MSTEGRPVAAGVWEQDLTTGRATASPGLCRLLGVDACPDLDTLLARLHRDDRAPARAALAAAAIAPFDLETRLADDAERRVRWTGEAVDGRLVAVARDVTADAQAAAAARRALHARDEVLAVISHDLRSPLSIVSMAADAIRDTGGEAWSEELGMIKRAVTRMNRLIVDLLDVTRIESGRIVFERQPHDPAALAREAVDRFRPEADRRGLTLSLETAPGLPTVHADRERVVQALAHLIDNALKFTGAGAVTVRVDLAAGGVCFSVTDTGPGIDDASVERLFERFWRAEPGRARRGYGGLGLALVKGIVDGHGGRVAVDSAPGRGSRFAFTLPPA